MRSINRAPFSSSCINISGDSETNRSAFDLLLATQKRGPLYPRQGPHSSPGTEVSTKPWETQDGRAATSPQAWCGLESRARFYQKQPHPRLLFLEMGERGLLRVCSWRCCHRCCPRARSRGDTRLLHRPEAGAEPARTGGHSSGCRPRGLSRRVPLTSPRNTPLVYSFKCSFMEHIILGPGSFSSSPLPTGF